MFTAGGKSWLPAWARPAGQQRWQWYKLAFAVLVTVLGAAVAAALWLSQWSLPDGWTGTFKPSKYLDITGTHAAVASDSGLCSQMGINVLKQGGNAADAAVQVALCIGSVEPQSSGIGGGSFITVRFPNGTAFVIDARETAPRNSSKHMFDRDAILSKYTGLASAVPGEVMGLERLWQLAGGQRPWAELVEPVAALNDGGFPLGEAVADSAQRFRAALQTDPPRYAAFINGSDWCWLFGDEPGCAGAGARGLPTPGHLIRRPKLAATLRSIATNGSRAFYHGTIPRQLSEITQARGGVLTPEDFANYSVIVRPALHGRYNGHNFVTAPAPASGAPLVMGLRVMEELQRRLGANGQPVDGNTLVHRTVETMKWMAAARSELGDPDFVANPRAEAILDPDWARNVLGNISDAHTLDSWRDYHPSYEMNDPHGTTHFSIVDKDGMAVAMTSTVNLLFGNGVCDPVTGIIMNSEMDDFSTPVRKNGFELAPSRYNFVEPGKRPLSSTVPTILYNDDGEVELVIGGAGGSRILTSVFLAITRMYGTAPHLTGLQAVAYPRYHHQLIPEAVMLEPGFGPRLVTSLMLRGHQVELRPPSTAMNLVYRDDKKVLHANSDFYRKRGLGAAY